MTTRCSQSIVSMYSWACAYSCLKPNVVRSPEQTTRSGSSSLISAIARSSRLGTKCCPPQWGSERWAMVNALGAMCAQSVRTVRKMPARRTEPRTRSAARAAPGRSGGVQAGRNPAAQSEHAVTLGRSGAGNTGFPGISWLGAAEVRQPRRARVREDLRLLRRPVGVRAAQLPAPLGRRGARRGGVQARLLSPRAESLCRDHGDEAVARDAEEPQDPQGPGAVSGRQGQALLPARHRAPCPAIRPETRVVGSAEDAVVGDVYLAAGEIAARVAELGREIAADYQ